MTDIVVAALRRTLPALLSEDELKNAEGQVEGEKLIRSAVLGDEGDHLLGRTVHTVRDLGGTFMA
jgi:hypothetical protein